MMRQTYQALECEYHRREYNVSAVYNEPINGLEKGEWRSRIDGIYTFEVGKPNISTVTPVSEASALLKLFHLYRPNNELVPYIVNHSDIVIFEYGLHYLEDQAQLFGKHIQSSASQMQQQDPRIPLLWRGTSSQHWNTSGGYFTRTYQGNTRSITQSTETFTLMWCISCFSRCSIPKKYL
jgi:hypothetical protein